MRPSLEIANRLRPDDSLTLCIDLDGTLLKTDTLLETVLALVKQKPLYMLLLPFWFFKGRAYLKQQIARHVTLDVACLPYHPEFLTYLREEHRAGRKLVLATGADVKIAQQIATHLGLFSTVLATNGDNNLTGQRKLQLLKRHIGEADFIYAGNSRIDLPIWRISRNAIVVNASKRLLRRVSDVTGVIHVFQRRRQSFWTFIKAIRVHQWVKNFLIFIPLITSHQIVNPDRLFNAIIAFVAFSLCSSGAYVMNDLLDLETDRRHPTKRHRPLAAGDLSFKLGLIVPPFFCFAAFALSWLLSPSFVLILGAYLISTLAYSFFLKRILLLDVFVLASLYTLRIIAGGAATHIMISHWLLLFSLFLFLSLAFLKRFSELQTLHQGGDQASKARGYLIGDIEQLASMGSASGYITALVLALYINSDAVNILYARPEVLWLICPLILYWISRAWLIARRGQMPDDPVVFAIKDASTYAIGMVAAIIFVFAIG